MTTAVVAKLRVTCQTCGHFLGLAGQTPNFTPWCGYCKRLVPIDK